MKIKNLKIKAAVILWAAFLLAPNSYANSGSDLSEEKSLSSTSSGPRLTWDLSLGAGSYRGTSYTETHLGLNLFFLDWLAWRNAGFARFVQPKNYYGLDSSLMLIFSPELMEGFGVTLSGGPGYRFVTEGNSVAFAEGSLTLHMGGLNVGAGVKTLFNSFVDPNVPDDTQYFIILSGSGVL